MKKIIFTLLITFFACSSVYATDKNTITLNYPIEKIDNFLKKEIAYEKTNVQSLINQVEEKYQNEKYVLAINPYSEYFYIIFYKNSEELYINNYYSDGFSSGIFISSLDKSKLSTKYCSFTNLDQYGSFGNSFEHDLDVCDNLQEWKTGDNAYSSQIMSLKDKTNFSDVTSYFYNSTIKMPIENNGFDLIIKSNLGTFNINEKNNSDYLMYKKYKDESVLTFSSDTRIISLDSDALADNNIIASMTTRTTFDPYDKSKYKYFYYFKEDGKEESKNFKEITFEDDYFEYKVKKNGTLYFKVTSLGENKIYYSSTYLIDKIGQKYDSNIIDMPTDADDFLSSLTWDNIMNIITSPIDFVKKAISWVLDFFKNWFDSKTKILSQFIEIINSFKYSNGYCNYDFSSNEGFLPGDNHPDTWFRYCIPEFKVDFSFIGVDKKLSVGEFTWFIPHRDNVLNFVKIIVAFITFYKLLDIISGIRLRNTR